MTYRDKPDGCDRCREREEALATMEPFHSAESYGSAFECPACRAMKGTMSFQMCCGNVLYTIKKRTFARDVTEICKVTSVSHFHMACGRCGYKWLMRTALERKIRK